MPARSAKLIFSTSVEALLKVAQGKLKPEAWKVLSSLRMGPPHKLEPAYPAEDWAKAVKLIGASLFPALDAEQQQYEVARVTVNQFTDGWLGKAMFGAVKLVGARRSLQRLTNSLRSGANFLETRLTVVDDRTLELWLNDASGVPHFYAGLLSAGSPHVQGWPDSITVKNRDGDACVLELKTT